MRAARPSIPIKTLQSENNLRHTVYTSFLDILDHQLVGVHLPTPLPQDTAPLQGNNQITQKFMTQY